MKGWSKALETSINWQPLFDLDKHQEGKLGYVNWDVVYDKCTPPLYNGYVTNSGQKETYRILFLSETFNPWNSLSSSDLYVFGKLFFPLLPSDTWRQSYCKVASSSRILSVCWAFVAYLRSCLKRQRGFWSRSDLSNFSVHQRERDVQAAAVKFSLQFKEEQ